jgi:hypothetical protein
MRLGDSDIVRLSLVPFRNGYAVKAEFPEHQVQTQEVPVERPAGYTLSGIARLDGVGFEIAPNGELEQVLPLGETVAWRWTLSPRSAGQQRLSIMLRLRWSPDPGVSAPLRELQVFSQGLNIQVSSFLGLSRTQAMSTGLFSLLLGAGCCIVALLGRPRVRRTLLQTIDPNESLAIEPHPGLKLSPIETGLLQALFRRYARLVVESEFLSGYSGARTFLVQPVHPGGRADAYTIVKIGPRQSIQQEFNNYETYVKDSLPPITARIQHPPVTVRGSNRAALQYTFIAEPGRMPVSLRNALLQNPDPALLVRLFETFGPNWWMQRHTHIFRLAQEYDRLLPPHYVIEPAPSNGPVSRLIQESDTPGDLKLQTGNMVDVNRFACVEQRMDGQSLTLIGKAHSGQPALRLRWLSPKPPEHSRGRIVANRGMLLQDLVSNFDRQGLADPLLCLSDVLNENITGTQSIIHGDLNLENVLVGPGNFIWLIDFAQTRLGHPLFDFARLEAEIIAHVLSSQVDSPGAYLALLNAGHPLLKAVEEIAGRCLFNSSQMREYWLSLYLTCLGELKFANLDERSRHLLYLTAAYISEKIRSNRN